MNVSAPFSSAFVLRGRLFVCAAALCLCCKAVFAQAPAASGDYTTALPSVERVEAQIQGTDPTDTAARQVAVFEYLQVYIQRIKETRDYRGPYSPQGCSAVIQGMPKYYVTTTKLDTSGKATLSATATTGVYYFFAIVPDSGGSLVWDVPANLAAGDNSVAFNQTNAERMQ